MRIRTALPVALLLLGGCMTVPSGIVDNFVPPQGQTVVTEIKTPLCNDTAPNEPNSTTESIAPCTTEVITIAVAPPPKLTPSAFQRNRPRPPRMPGRR